MTVVAHEPLQWFLSEEDGVLYLDGTYSHSFVGFTYPIRLDGDKTEAYEREGHTFIQSLFERVQYSAPLLDASTSVYKGRRLSADISSKLNEAVRDWNATT